jgi:hypothetical protein
LCDASDPKPRYSYCAGRRIPAAPFFVSRQFQMNSQFVFEITIGPRSPKRAPQAAEPFAVDH